MLPISYVLYGIHFRYDKARSEVDTIFGPKFHPRFPRRLRSCDESCGNYPSTDEGRYNDGIDLVNVEEVCCSRVA